jgi:hypothetical protein
MPPLPGRSPQRQPVHADADFVHPEHPFALVINVPLVGMCVFLFVSESFDFFLQFVGIGFA